MAGILEERFGKASTLTREAKEEVLAFTAFLTEHWRQIWSTNPILAEHGAEAPVHIGPSSVRCVHGRIAHTETSWSLHSNVKTISVAPMAGSDSRS
jgi:hypothetical protein